MKTRKVNFIFLLFLICFYTQSAIANCNFKTSAHLENLNNTQQIEKIEIEINEYRKWTKNALNSVKNINLLQKKNKKKFKSKLKVFYKFGICEYEAHVRLHGDKKDHIDLDQGKLRASLDIDLTNGNIKTATEFKLLLPETRFGNNEIFSTIFLRKLGFIAPDTFNIKIRLNNLEYIALFQEKANKELLEKNNKVEGPIFEGDEEILWLNEKKLSEYNNFQLEKFSASRIINKNWALKDTNSLLIALRSFIKLQKAYFKYSLGDGAIYINPNLEKSNLFALYDLTLMSMNGFHGLRPHNRKFYYNIQDNVFEPIYYDGSVVFKNDFFIKNYLEFLNKNDLSYYSKSLKIDDLQEVSKRIKKMDIKNIIEEYQILANLKHSDAKNDVNFFLKIIDQNLKVIKSNIIDYKTVGDEKVEKKIWKDEIIKLENIHKFKQLYLSIESIDIKNNKITINCLFQENCKKNQISFEELAQIMQRNNFNGKRAVIFRINENIKEEKQKFIKNVFNQKYIVFSPTADIKFDQENRTINLIQNYSDDWFLIKNQKLKKIKIKLIGVKKNNKKNNYFQRINPRGLTGCLTLYNIEFAESSILANRGECEDSVNIIMSRGEINNVKISDALSDALDIDFSNININNVNIKDALNDCLDFSYGNYKIDKVELINCKDKGISVGESSNMIIKDAFISESNVGIASKDSSKVFIQKGEFNEIKICLSAYNKKQEFFGARLNIKNFKCTNYHNLKDTGKNSSIINK